MQLASDNASNTTRNTNRVNKSDIVRTMRPRRLDLGSGRAPPSPLSIPLLALPDASRLSADSGIGHRVACGVVCIVGSKLHSKASQFSCERPSMLSH